MNLINNYLGKLPFAKSENANTFEKYFNEIKSKFVDNYSDYLNYFYKEWKQFFINKMLYYNYEDKSIGINNIIENYNSQINRIILNGKKLLSWSDYINFLLEEEYRFKEKLSNIKK